jgi:hypothetical protein
MKPCVASPNGLKRASTAKVIRKRLVEIYEEIVNWLKAAVKIGEVPRKNLFGIHCCVWRITNFPRIGNSPHTGLLIENN